MEGLGDRGVAQTLGDAFGDAQLGGAERIQRVTDDVRPALHALGVVRRADQEPLDLTYDGHHVADVGQVVVALDHDQTRVGDGARAAPGVAAMRSKRACPARARSACRCRHSDGARCSNESPAPQRFSTTSMIQRILGSTS